MHTYASALVIDALLLVPTRSLSSLSSWGPVCLVIITQFGHYVTLDSHLTALSLGLTLSVTLIVL